MNDFLPPWLREPEEEKPTPPAPPPPPPPAPANEGGLPPWLADNSPKSRTMLQDTGELSDDFLDAGDGLADTFESSVTYDQWKNIQHEKQREKSLDEEVPDLLGNLPPGESPFPDGTMKLPDTGELPNWFLGLEELDEEQAPSWFTQETPVVSAPPPPIAAIARPPLSDDPLDDFFAGIGDQRVDTPMALSPDLFATVMQPDPTEDSGAYIPPPRDSALDDFYSSLGAGQKAAAADANDSFYAEFAQPPPVESLPPLDIDFGDDGSNETPNVPLNPTKPLNLPEAIDFEFEQSDDDYYDPTMPSKATLRSLDDVEPDAAPLNAESLSWLNEISSMIGNVVNEESRRASDDDLFVQTPSPDDFAPRRDTPDNLGQRGQTGQFADDAPPDWLSQLGAMLDVTDDSGTPTQTPPPEPAAPPRPALDFSNLDTRQAPPPPPTADDPFAAIFARQTPAQQEAEPKRRTKGGTIILPEDSQVPQQAESSPAPSAPRGTYQLPSDLDRLADLNTDELDASLFGDIDALPPARPAPSKPAPQPIVPPRAATPLPAPVAPPPQEDDYFSLAELTDSYPRVVVEPEPVADDSEALDWLQGVEFEDTAPMPPVDEAVIAAASSVPIPTPVVDNQPKGITDNLTDLFSALNDSAAVERAKAAVPPRPATPPPVPVPPPLSPIIDDAPPLFEIDESDAYTGALADDGLLAVEALSPEAALTSLLESFAPIDTGSLSAQQPAREESPEDDLAALLGSFSPLETGEVVLQETSMRASDEFEGLLDLFDSSPDLDFPPSETSMQVTMGELDIDALLGGLESPTKPTPPEDALSALFDTPTQRIEQDFDALFGDLGSPVEIDLTPPEAPRIAASTGELTALFDAFDADAERAPQFEITTPQERPMPANDDFDALFDDMDNDSPDDQLPSTGMLAGISATDETHAVAPDDNDLEALFAAYETEQRAPTETEQPAAPVEPMSSEFDFPDDDSFFSALGLDEASASPPPPPKSPSSDDEFPDDDFLRSFSQPEASNTADASGTDPSLWEDETEALDWNTLAASAYQDAAPVSAFEQELPHIEAFDYDAEREAAAAAVEDINVTAAASASDWFADEEASPAPPISISDWDPPESPVAAPIDTSTLPEWMGELDTIGEEIQARAAAATEPEAPSVDLEGYIAGLDSTGTLLPHSANLSSVARTTSEIDIDALFSDDMMLDVPDIPMTEDEPLAQSDMLGDLQASVGEVSATAMTRQLQDKPEAELSDRLKKLRIRATEEIPAITVPADDNMADVLPGVTDALAPAPFVVETTHLVGGALLRDPQRHHVGLLRDLLGLQDGTPAPTTGTKVSAIDLTYEAPHLRDGDDEPAPEPAAAPVFVPTPVRRQRTYRIDRLIISLLLAAGIILPFYVPEARFGDPPPIAFADDSREATAFRRIDALQEYDLVLVGLDYSPAAAPELDEMTAALVQHILLRGARPVFVSSNPFGVLRAQTFIDRLNEDDEFLARINQRVPLEANVEYFVTQFLPGSAVGLRAFGEAAGDLLRLDISGQATGLNLESLSNFALVTLITDRAEEVRAYAEQIAPLAGRPLVVAVNYASAPLAEPYAATRSAIDGLLVGYVDATTYAGLLPDVRAVERGARPVLPQDVTTPDDAPPDNPDATAEPTSDDPNATPAPDATAEATSDAALFNAIVTSADGANLRSGPGTDFARVVGLARNSELIVLGFSDDGEWVNVRTDDGTEGWVSAGLIVINEAADEDAEATPTPNSSSSVPSLLSVFAQTDDDAPAAVSPRWYAMTMGIALSALIIGLGAILGILRGILTRRAR